MQVLTKEQAIVITGYTGYCCCNFADFHADVEKRLGHSVWTHQFASPEMRKKLKEIYKPDFVAICVQDMPRTSRAAEAA